MTTVTLELGATFFASEDEDEDIRDATRTPEYRLECLEQALEWFCEAAFGVNKHVTHIDREVLKQLCPLLATNPDADTLCDTLDSESVHWAVNGGKVRFQLTVPEGIPPSTFVEEFYAIFDYYSAVYVADAWNDEGFSFGVLVKL